MIARFRCENHEEKNTKEGEQEWMRKCYPSSQKNIFPVQLTAAARSRSSSRVQYTFLSKKSLKILIH